MGSTIFFRFRWLVVVVLAGLLQFTPAAADDDCQGLADAVGHGGVIWSRNAIVVQGTAAPDLSRQNRSVAVIKRMAQKAATLDAYRKAAGILAGVRITSETGAAGDSQVVTARINAFVRNAKICKTKYYADGGVDMVVMLPLNGAFAADMLAAAGSRQARQPSAYSGLVIDARHLSFAPALVPRILTPDGTVLFGIEQVNRAVLTDGGAVRYVNDAQEVAKDWIGPKPLQAAAIGLGERSPSDIVVDRETAEVLLQGPAFLGDGKIAVVIRPAAAPECGPLPGGEGDRLIDWEHRLVLARGVGKMNFARKQDDAVRMRLMERAAEVDAQHKLVQALLQLRVGGGKLLEGDRSASGQVAGTVLNAFRCDAKYFRDGSAEMVLAAPLDGLAKNAGTTGSGTPGSVPTDGAVSGLIVEATHVGFRPVLLPVLEDPDGNAVYGPEFAARDYVSQYGVAGYRTSRSAALADERVGSTPLVVKAESCDNQTGRLTLSPADAAAVKKLQSTATVLARARVVIVTKQTADAVPAKHTARGRGATVAAAGSGRSTGILGGL